MKLFANLNTLNWLHQQKEKYVQLDISFVPIIELVFRSFIEFYLQTSNSTHLVSTHTVKRSRTYSKLPTWEWLSRSYTHLEMKSLEMWIPLTSEKNTISPSMTWLFVALVPVMVMQQGTYWLFVLWSYWNKLIVSDVCRRKKNTKT